MRSPFDVLAGLEAREPGSRAPLVVLDLDSTLIDTAPRHRAILEAFAAAEAPELRALLPHIPPSVIGWSVSDNLQEHGVEPSLVARYEAFWAARFFDGAWCRHDTATEGAVAYVQRVLEAGGVAYYLTARPAPTMGHHTVQRLSALGFPILRGRAVLHMKPSVSLDDGRFKRSALREAAQLGEVVASFENEPAHANALLAAFPTAQHFLVGDVRSPRGPEPDPAVIPIRDFLAPR